MTRKDYELIAGALREALQAEPHSSGKAAIESLVFRMARHLKQTNPRFDADRFISAVITD